MPILIFCYDAYCQWSFAFKETMMALNERYNNAFQIEVLSGGLIQPKKPVPIEVFATSLVAIEKEVIHKTGTKFGNDFLWHIHNPTESDWFPNSLTPAIALGIFKEVLPNKQVDFAIDLLIALQIEGRDLTDPEAYRHLLEKYSLDEPDFYSKLKSDYFAKKANNEFKLCKQLKANSFPSIYIQNNNGKLFFVHSGFASFDEVKDKLEGIINKTSS
jgi:putative protein-disulfide isomerase